MSQDITFCGSDCDNKKCFRHPSNIKEPRIPHSFAYLKDTDDCPMKKQEVRCIDANALKEEFSKYKPYAVDFLSLIDNAPTVEPEELKRVRDICEHWNDNSSSFVSACNAFEDILHIFKMGVGDMRGDTHEQ